MVGVDFNEKARIATACNLDAHQVPHRVVSGDIGKPSALMAQLTRKKVGMGQNTSKPIISTGEEAVKQLFFGKFSRFFFWYSFFFSHRAFDLWPGEYQEGVACANLGEERSQKLVIGLVNDLE